MAVAFVALSAPGDDEMVFERTGRGREARLLIEIGANASASFRVEQSDVTHDKGVATGVRPRDGPTHVYTVARAGESDVNCP
jgi:hypothetical protein